MRTWSALLVLTCACSSKSNSGLPIGGGGGGGGGTGQVDAPKPQPDAPIDANPTAIDAPIVRGRVCLVTSDPRHLGLNPSSDCASTGANGLTVRIGGNSATTAADGSFAIDGSGITAGAVWSVTGSNIVSSYQVFSDYQIPAITTALYQSMQTQSSVIPISGQGSIIALLARNGAGISAYAAAASPAAPLYSPRYDGSSTTAWTNTTSTGANGVVWIPGLNVGSSTVTAGPAPLSGTGTITTAAQPVVDGSITFVTIVFP